MVQIANARTALLSNAVAHLGVVLLEEDEEGRRRHLHDLTLSNPALSLFPLTWTVMHEINETSPLAGCEAEHFRERDARLVLTLEAYDHVLGAAVHDMRVYTADEVLFGMHYAEAVTLDDQLRRLTSVTLRVNLCLSTAAIMRSSGNGTALEVMK